MDHSDRCDKCGAQAFVRAVFPTTDLMFCAHHGHEFRVKLASTALFVEDNTESINKKPSVAAF